MSHSKGPWTVRKNFGGHWGMREVIGPALSIIGFTSATDINNEKRAQIEADAPLIASAPDMLAALLWLKPYARLQVHEYPNGEDIGGWRMVLAAIERATGGGA